MILLSLQQDLLVLLVNLQNVLIVSIVLLNPQRDRIGVAILLENSNAVVIISLMVLKMM